MAEKYIYAVARIRALEMSLFSQTTIEQLIAAKSYKESIQFLIEHGWGNSETDGDNAEAILNTETKRTWEVISEMVPDMSVFDVILMPDLFHNLKAAIKTVVAGETPADVFYENCSISGEQMLEIVKNKDFSLLPSYMQACAEEAYESMAHIGDGQMCDVIIDRGTLLAMMEAAKKAKDDLLKDYAENTVAVANIKIAVRSHKTAKSMEFMRRAMAPCESLNIDRLAKAALSGMDDIIKYLEETEYRGGAEALSISSSAFERWCDNRIIETIKPQKFNSFTVGPLVAYILARLNEIKTVRIVLSGKLNGLPDEAIRERVREMYV
ncbi:MAG: V0D/AC39 family V-type ATPase subunit [Coprococcus sp.]